MDSSGHTAVVEDFQLECGERLQAAACYNTFGVLSASRDNVIVVCHALTGNSRLDQWWGGLLGPGLAFDTDRYFIVCFNVLGSCYGSSGPRSPDPHTGLPYGNRFPQVTIRDSVRLHLLVLRQQLGVRRVLCAIGGSMGGMQALEWAYLGDEDYAAYAQAHAQLQGQDVGQGQGQGVGGHEKGQEAEQRVGAGPADEVKCTEAITPNLQSTPSTPTKPFVKSAVLIGCGAQHTAWQIAISEAQRQAIYADPKWRDGDIDFCDGPSKGLAVARQIAMISYRTAASYHLKFGRDREPESGRWQVQNYLLYQGQKFLDRFDALTYVRLTQLMDSHDVGRDRGGVEHALAQIRSKVLVVGLDSDLLYPLSEQQELASLIPGASLQVIHTANGHDGFLLEQTEVSSGITSMLQSL